MLKKKKIRVPREKAILYSMHADHEPWSCSYAISRRIVAWMGTDTVMTINEPNYLTPLRVWLTILETKLKVTHAYNVATHVKNDAAHHAMSRLYCYAVTVYRCGKDVFNIIMTSFRSRPSLVPVPSCLSTALSSNKNWWKMAIWYTWKRYLLGRRYQWSYIHVIAIRKCDFGGDHGPAIVWTDLDSAPGLSHGILHHPGFRFTAWIPITRMAIWTIHKINVWYSGLMPINPRSEKNCDRNNCW